MPRKQCDLVMKGGITSGIVYPRAVCELAKEFTFANIGGTSAGAIAAALTAAAEYRRFHGSDEGFAALEELPEWLAHDSNLLRLFEPSEETAPLYDVAVRWLQTGSIAATLRALVARFNRFGGAVAAVAAIVAVALLLRPSWIGILALAIVLAAGAIGFVAASVVEALLHASRALPRNGFGLCSGSGALTKWLGDQIQSVAGVDHPLTFGELTAAGVNLEMMTTNLTHGRPYRLPFSSNKFYFDEAEFRGLFPKEVVDFMIARSQVSRGTRLLPRAQDLPVIVAARMSLSFPLLLSAIPLHAIDYGRRDGNHAPERCWFSDGGISSNFPVHFFDAPLPRRPTFAINLAERTPRYHAPDQRIYAPRTNLGGLQEWWRAIDTLPSFLWSIVETMQNWRDNMLLRMPGYRDRIVHVLLAPGEGGLNLTMDPTTIDDVAGRGTEAARELRARFGDGPPPAGVTLTWRNHRWVRFRAFMGALEEGLEEYAEAFDDYRDLLDGPVPSYKPSASERKAMRETALAFVQHINTHFGGRFGGARRPNPRSVLRAVPEV